MKDLQPYSESKFELNSSDTKNLRLCLYLSFLHLKPDIRYSSLSFVRLSSDKTIYTHLQLTGKTSLALDSQLKFAFRIRQLIDFKEYLTISY